MKYKGTLIAVSDMEKSKVFYKEILGLQVVDDFGANVMLEGGIFLQTIDTWKNFIFTDKIKLPNNACELYFEEEQMDKFLIHLEKSNINYVHKPMEHRWGQRAVRFYDLDDHIIEVGEKISSVVKGFYNQGMSFENIAKRMDVSINYVRRCLDE